MYPARCFGQEDGRNGVQGKRNVLSFVSALPDLVFIFDREAPSSGVSRTRKAAGFARELSGRQAGGHSSAEVCSRRTLNNVVLQPVRNSITDLDGVEHYFHARMVPFAGDKVMAVVRNVSEIVETIRQDRMKGVNLTSRGPCFAWGTGHNVRQRRFTGVPRHSIWSALMPLTR